MLEGKRVYMPGQASFGIYRKDYKGAQLPPLSRKRFKKEVEYANTPGRNKHKYVITADIGPAFKQKIDEHKIKLTASQLMKEALNKILTKTNFEYPTYPWQ